VRVIIFTNGEINYPQRLLDLIEEGDVLIAADGGARHCLRLGLLPKLVIGDFDSLSETELNNLEEAGAELQRHPTHKDETDLELALLAARDQGAERVVICGALGARWDMTLANILLLAHPEFSSLSIHIVDGPQELSLLQGGQTRQIVGEPGDTLSLMPLLGGANGITTQGLEYPLENGSLRIGATRGVSNVMISHLAQVQLDEGLLLVVLNKDRRP